jgi:hypothetical protein
MEFFCYSEFCAFESQNHSSVMPHPETWTFNSRHLPPPLRIYIYIYLQFIEVVITIFILVVGWEYAIVEMCPLISPLSISRMIDEWVWSICRTVIWRGKVKCFGRKSINLLSSDAACLRYGTGVVAMYWLYILKLYFLRFWFIIPLNTAAQLLNNSLLLT